MVALVGGLGQRNAAVRDLEHRVTRDQRGGVAVGTESEVDAVERLRQRVFVVVGGALEVALGHRHRPQRRLVVHREAEHHVGEVAVLAARRGDPLVDLE